MGARGRKGQLETMAPSPLALVAPSLPVELPAPPDHLSDESKAWWREIVATFELDPHHLKLLEAAADAWDRMVEARTQLATDGITVESGAGTKKVHPAVAVERDSRAAFARLIRELDLDEPVPSPAAYMRPPALRSNRRR
jgi:P27 family predicted phage terminase small subunit